MPLLNYEQPEGEPSKKAHVTPAGRKVASKVGITDMKCTAALMEAMEGTVKKMPLLRPKQT